MKKNLLSLKVGESSRIVSIKEGDVEIKLMEMGCVPGTNITVESKAPFGDPIVVNLSGYSLSLRKKEAEMIEVG